MVVVRERSKEVNIADLEHMAALATGALMLACGFRRRDALGAALRLGGLALLFRGQQGYRRLYEALGIPLPYEPTGVGRRAIRVESSVVVNRPREEVYRIWRNLNNLPIFMDHIANVHEIDDIRSIWVARAPGGMVVKWDASIINDVENELIAWTTLEGSGVDHAGSVRFSDEEGGGTRIQVVLRYAPPADLLGSWIAQVFRSDPQRQIDRDLQHFKAIMEIGGAPHRRKPKASIR